MEIIRDLSYDERAKYGECRVCKAAHGEACNPDVGIPLGRNPPRHGAHLARLQAAPMRVKEVPA